MEQLVLHFSHVNDWLRTLLVRFNIRDVSSFSLISAVVLRQLWHVVSFTRPFEDHITFY
jgi:hypothetical protein